MRYVRSENDEMGRAMPEERTLMIGILEVLGFVPPNSTLIIFLVGPHCLFHQADIIYHEQMEWETR